jgi:hypothetical protein
MHWGEAERGGGDWNLLLGLKRTEAIGRLLWLGECLVRLCCENPLAMG